MNTQLTRMFIWSLTPVYERRCMLRNTVLSARAHDRSLIDNTCEQPNTRDTSQKVHAPTEHRIFVLWTCAMKPDLHQHTQFVYKYEWFKTASRSAPDMEIPIATRLVLYTHKYNLNSHSFMVIGLQLQRYFMVLSRCIRKKERTTRCTHKSRYYSTYACHT